MEKGLTFIDKEALISKIFERKRLVGDVITINQIHQTFHRQRFTLPENVCVIKKCAAKSVRYITWHKIFI